MSIVQALKLTEEQKAHLRKAFDLLDKNSNGTVCTSELGVAMKSIGLNPSEDELKSIIRKADDDNNGTLSFTEFQSMMFETFNKSKMEAIREIFREYDINNDGTITPEELRKLFQSDEYKAEGGESDDAVIEKMFREIDIDKDGKIHIEGEAISNVQCHVVTLLTWVQSRLCWQWTFLPGQTRGQTRTHVVV
jgi:calmodulin